MKTLFESAALDEFRDRLARLKPESERQWGRMNVAQMLAHCSAWIELASGRTSRPRHWLGYVFGRLAKRSLLDADRPVRRNMPSDKGLIVNETRDFALERERLKECMERFTADGPGKCSNHSHPFFGPMASHEWGALTYKHLDHHFRQFGI